MSTHDKEGNRCLDVARSRYKHTLASAQGTYRGSSTWHFTNPSTRQVDDRYSGNSVVMLRSMHIVVPEVLTKTLPMLAVHLDGLSMPNNAASIGPVGNLRIGDMIQSSAIGVVNLKNGNVQGEQNGHVAAASALDNLQHGVVGNPIQHVLVNAAGELKKKNPDPAAVAATPLVPAEETKRIVKTFGERFSGSVAECGQLVAGDLVNSDLTVRLQGIGVTQEQTNLFFEPTLLHEWVCELEVQALLNYNKHDGEY
jgi:hypothetical protein